MRGPKGTKIADPDELFRRAHELDMLLETDYLVFLQALVRRPRNVCSFVNLFGPTVEQFSLRLREDLIQTDLTKLVLEINEKFAPSAWSKLQNCLHPLRERGLKIALDDLGSGFSNLDAVVDLHPDLIKIDRDVVSSIAMSKESVELVDRVRRLAEKLDMNVIAEGVETEQQAALLREMGVTLGQGFLFGRPEPLPL